jgi:heme/copper-type cytochrome/quinol oxidase subunit 3
MTSHGLQWLMLMWLVSEGMVLEPLFPAGATCQQRYINRRTPENSSMLSHHTSCVESVYLLFVSATFGWHHAGSAFVPFVSACVR